MPRTQTATHETEAAGTANQTLMKTINNETGRGYFRHPVSPLATVRESFLPFIGRPASYDVESRLKRP
jgi:hypothetical protein